jgi:hypothetical protein
MVDTARTYASGIGITILSTDDDEATGLFNKLGNITGAIAPLGPRYKVTNNGRRLLVVFTDPPLHRLDDFNIVFGSDAENVCEALTARIGEEAELVVVESLAYG